MKERPLLFSAPMVRALLDGSKTQTRRILKVKPDFVTSDGIPARFTPQDENLGRLGEVIHCPYGQPGDRLWVRESFWGCDLPGYGDTPCVVYDDEWHGKEYLPAEARPWARKFGRIPSIHMPRNCSRITLEITGVRVERLQDISEEDAIAEGIHCLSNGQFLPMKKGYSGGLLTAASAYRALWEIINGAGSWDENPFVWVIEFRRIK